MHPTSPIDWPTIPQTGAEGRSGQAEPGQRSSCRQASTFRCTRWCRTPRHIAVGPAGASRRSSGTRKSKVWVVTDRVARRRGRRGEGVRADLAEEDYPMARASRRTAFASRHPSRIACSSIRRPSSSTRARTLLLSVDRARRRSSFPRPRRATTTRRARAASGRTTSSTFSSDQPYNVPAKEKFDMYRKLGIGGIIRMDRDGKNREVYATGLAQSGRHGLQPEGQDRSGPTTTRSTAWATTSRRAR